VTGHAPYSSTPELLQLIKKRCVQQGEIYSLHLAENRDEAPLLTTGEGCFADMLSQRQAWDGTFPVPGIDISSVVRYLQTLGIFDNKTICVHCVHVSDSDLAIIKDTGAHVCLCPGSNEFLGVGSAPLMQMLDCGLLPALGTDSIASNPDLDMWREMSLIRQTYPDVSSEVILGMATLGGARAMHRDEDFGSIEEGRMARFIQIQDRRYEHAESGEQLMDLLTSCGRPHSIEWPCHEG
ncbi:MAG: amidohydrolase family protein, partial [Thermodesulfobacteriota bacterium]